MQCGGDFRDEILQRILYFNHVFEQDPYQIPKVRKYLTVFFAYVEKIMESYINIDSSIFRNEDWYDEEDEEIDQQFKDWNEEDDK